LKQYQKNDLQLWTFFDKIYIRLNKGAIMTYSLNLTEQQIKKIISNYQDYSVDLTSVYMTFRAKVKTSSLTIYQTNKILIQGANCHELYIDICNLIDIKTKETKENIENPIVQNFTFSVVGTDEVGTGDYFGGITVCACFVPIDKILLLKKLGVKDSKKITDTKIMEIAPILKKELVHSTILLNNEKYNKICSFPNMNLNKIKAVLHNKVINNILKNDIKYEEIIIDGFTTTEKYFEYLQNQTNVIKNVKLVEGGEDKYIAIAAASIIARYHFLEHMKDLSAKCGYELLKGAGSNVDKLLAKILKDHNEELLPTIAKLNFKTTLKVKNILRNAKRT
jgi:ribonuclease HIII